MQRGQVQREGASLGGHDHGGLLHQRSEVAAGLRATVRFGIVGRGDAETRGDRRSTEDRGAHLHGEGLRLAPAIEEAAQYDRKIVIEAGVGGKKNKAREIECAVLGNDNPEASVAGEIVPMAEFYDYTAKYLDEGSQLIIPAKLTHSESKRVRELAIAAFRAVDCSGLARVDFLMDPKSRKIYLNEINTMPGFTSISMYPKLWAASGVAYPELIERLIHLGFDRHEEKKKNHYSRG